MREAGWEPLRSSIGFDSMEVFHHFRAMWLMFCSAADLLVNWMRVERPQVVISEAFLASLSTHFIPVVPPWPRVHVIVILIAELLVKISRKLVWNRMDAVWEGCGDPSKIFWMAEEASEKIWTWVIWGLAWRVQLMEKEACVRPYISASHWEAFLAKGTLSLNTLWFMW